MTVHVLSEYGDPENVHWQGPPWVVRLKTVALGIASRLHQSPNTVRTHRRNIRFKLNADSALTVIALPRRA